MHDSAAEAVVSKGPCPDCGSKDNLVTYADGHQFCYSPGCGLKKRGDHSEGETMETVTEAAPEDAIPFTTEHMQGGLKSRKLSLETLSRAGYFVHKHRGKAWHICPIYDQQGRMVYQKYRGADKQFFFEKVAETDLRPIECQLIGQQQWGEKADKRVVITEGELDKLSADEATKYKVPVVSLLQGVQSAKKCLQANYRWLDRFEEIILWFDNDEPGQSVIAECAALFEPGKVKTIVVPGAKDASDLKQAGKDGEIYAAIWAAVTWAPGGIVNAKDCIGDMDKPAAVKIADWPFPKVQEHTKGILEKEVVYHVAGTGVGKTSMIVEAQHALLEQGVKFGVMRFEDTRQKAQLDIMGRKVERRLHLEDPDTKFLRELHTETFGSGLVELFDPEVADWSLESIMGYVRYMVKGLDCKVVFIDPLSFVVAAANEQDERKALDNVAYQFSRTVKQIDANLQITHHLKRVDGRAHEDGGEISVADIRGSGGIANFSMTILAYERNQQGDRPDLARIRILKNRFAGWTGVADVVKWHEDRGYYIPTDEPYPETNSAPAFGEAPTMSEY